VAFVGGTAKGVNKSEFGRISGIIIALQTESEYGLGFFVHEQDQVNSQERIASGTNLCIRNADSE
jgi:hypothetical protein